MNSARALALLLIMSMLTACGSGPRPQIDERFGLSRNELPHSEQQEAVSEETAAANADQDDEIDPYGPDFVDHHHHHHEPSPGARHAAEAALIATGSIFLCSFVVVVLDGSCHFGLGFGYHYY